MGPLHGVRIIAVEQYGAGPFGSMQLADLGAEVIKIENPTDGGDMARRVGPYFLGENDSHVLPQLQPQQAQHHARPEAPEGARACCTTWRRGADAVLDNLRGDLPDKLGLTYDSSGVGQPEDRVRAPVRVRPRPARARHGPATTI